MPAETPPGFRGVVSAAHDNATELTCRAGSIAPVSTDPEPRIESSADVSASAVVGSGSRVWHLAQIRDGAQIGINCVIGRGAYIGSGVTIGNNCKVQNYALVYEPATLESGVFVGPAVVFTNDAHPRAVTPDGHLKSASDWQAVGVQVREGASIGANATCVAPLRIGRWAMVAAGAVVTKDVADYAIVAGVPARRIGWAGEAGVPLVRDSSYWRCPTTGKRYEEDEREGLSPVLQ